MKKFSKLGLTFLIIGIVLLLIIAIVGGYVLYVVLQYYRIDDNTVLEIENPQTLVFDAAKEYTLMTYNIGFGAYDRDYSFFMDVGYMQDGTKITGKYGKAVSEENVRKNTEGSVALAKENPCDFYFFQEVDVDADRSRNINQLDALKTLGTDYASVYASNFHSAYLLYPFNDPHGKTEAGLVTMSKYAATSAVRRSYPVDDSFPTRFFDLDRCFSVLRIPVGEKELVLVNSHMSAYDEGGTIRAAQLEMLNGFMSDEYRKGNYVIVGGDFNHDIANTSDKFPTTQKFPDWVRKIEPSDLAEGFRFAADDSVPTCRSAEMPYEEGVNFTVVVDGFIVSDNVEAAAVNIDNGFLYSDHNPVKLTFRLV